MDKKIDDFILWIKNKVIDRHEQYFCGNFILVHGVTESQYEDTDIVLTETLNELLQEKLTDVDIDQRHRIGKLKKGK